MEQFLFCPSCGARISVILDPSVAAQEFIEDCEVCCRPMTISYVTDGHRVTAFEAAPLDG